MLVILIWFLPVCVHVAGRTLANHAGLERLKTALIHKLLTRTRSPTVTPEKRSSPAWNGGDAGDDMATSRVKTRKSVSKVLDMVLQLLQLATFLATFRYLLEHIKTMLESSCCCCYQF